MSDLKSMRHTGWSNLENPRAVQCAPAHSPVPIRSAARLPVVRTPMLVRNGDHGCQLTVQLVPNRVRKPIKDVEVNPIIVRRPHISPVGEPVDSLKHLGSEGFRSERAAIKVPEKSPSKFLLGLAQNLDGETGHIALMRART